MKMQTYIYNRTLVLEEDLDESFKDYSPFPQTHANLQTYFNMEINQISLNHFVISRTQRDFSI